MLDFLDTDDGSSITIGWLCGVAEAVDSEGNREANVL